MKAPLHIAFRADASIEMGSGHVMRCLTLADLLAEGGARCHFICRDLPGHMMDYIGKRGHTLTRLAPPTPDQSESTLSAPQVPPHSGWAGVPLEDEIAQSREVLAKLKPDRVVLDHYALDARWEVQAPPPGTPVMVIDDLADRQHVCDILLDQNLGRRAEDYAGLVPPHCNLLVGPHYALLRPEFERLREKALARRKDARVENLLITLGGIDKDNATSAVLRALSGIPLPAKLKITVVMGQNAPFIDKVRAQAEIMPRPTRVLCGVSNLAQLMTEADLCIGAAGSTAWERCALALPTLLLVLADNQRPGAMALIKSGAAILLGDKRIENGSILLQKFLRNDEGRDRMRQMSSAAANLVDGAGVTRIYDHIQSHRDHMRTAKRDDIILIWEWRYADNAERFYRSTDVPSLAAHTTWMEKALTDPLRDLRIFYHAGQPVAHIRFDIDAESPAEAEIGICLSQAVRKQGIGQRALGMACATPPHGVQRLNAEVHKDNAASARIFEKLGFQRVGIDGEFLQMTLNIASSMQPAELEVLSEEKNSNDL